MFIQWTNKENILKHTQDKDPSIGPGHWLHLLATFLPSLPRAAAPMATPQPGCWRNITTSGFEHQNWRFSTIVGLPGIHLEYISSFSLCYNVLFPQTTKLFFAFFPTKKHGYLWCLFLEGILCGLGKQTQGRVISHLVWLETLWAQQRLELGGAEHENLLWSNKKW